MGTLGSLGLSLLIKPLTPTWRANPNDACNFNHFPKALQSNSTSVLLWRINFQHMNCVPALPKIGYLLPRNWRNGRRYIKKISQHYQFYILLIFGSFAISWPMEAKPGFRQYLSSLKRKKIGLEAWSGGWVPTSRAWGLEFDPVPPKKKEKKGKKFVCVYMWLLNTHTSYISKWICFLKIRLIQA
jgi:hypothetical protein